MSSSIGAIVFGTAALGLFNTGIILSGGGPVGLSQTSPVTVYYDKQPVDGVIHITSVGLGNIPSQAADGNYQIEVLFVGNSNNNALVFEKIQIPAGATDVTHALATSVSAEEVTGVKLAINPAP
jgi:hypothetical protein